MIISGSTDGTLRSWDYQGSGVLKTYDGHCSDVLCVCLSGNGEFVASGSKDKTIRSTMHSVYSNVCNSWAILFFQKVALKYLCICIIYFNRLWLVSTADCLHTMTGHSDSVSTISITHKGDKVVSGSLDGSLKVWNTDQSSQ